MYIFDMGYLQESAVLHHSNCEAEIVWGLCFSGLEMCDLQDLHGRTS